MESERQTHTWTGLTVRFYWKIIGLRAFSYLWKFTVRGEIVRRTEQVTDSTHFAKVEYVNQKTENGSLFLPNYRFFFNTFFRLGTTCELCEVNARIIFRQSVVRSFPDKNRSRSVALEVCWTHSKRSSITRSLNSVYRLKWCFEDALNVRSLEIGPIYCKKLCLLYESVE